MILSALARFFSIDTLHFMRVTPLSKILRITRALTSSLTLKKAQNTIVLTLHRISL